MTQAKERRLPVLVLAAAGVVFGDIGTSPLYSLQTVFSSHHNDVQPTRGDVLGVVSMVIWCLVLIVSISYVGFIMRADNKGEGGILSLAALLGRKLGRLPGAPSKRAAIAMVLAMVGAALFYGDSLITPAVSVLSAVEGVKVAQPHLAEWVVPIAVVILAGLFGIQRWGTSRIGKTFGPIMVVWFAVIAVLGVPQIVRHPDILWALSPTRAVAFMIERPFVAFIAAGAVVLAVTGVEALYADMGHFGHRPILVGWFSIVFPALVLNYLGQGAEVLANPATASAPFFHLAPDWARLPLVALATAATVIASQAVISGAFSVSRQATRLSMLPRLRVVQTSREEGGQIYVPAINAILFLGVLVLVLGFRSSENLASAYGLAVTATLLLEMSLFMLLAHSVWRWPLWRLAVYAVPVGAAELGLFSANVAKVFSGGWLPLTIATALIVIMATWRRGSRLAFGRREVMEGPIAPFIEKVHTGKFARVPGLAVYPHGNPETVPLALRENLRVNRVLHEHVVIITVKSIGVPSVSKGKRVRVSALGDPDDGIVHVTYRVGFNDSQNVPRALRQAVGMSPELDIDPRGATYLLSVFRIEPGHDKCMPRWQKTLFRALEKASANRTGVFHLPQRRTVVMGAALEM